MAPLWGRHRGLGESSLHQAHPPPPSPHDLQPLPGSRRSRNDPPPGRATSPQHMPTLDTPPDRRAHQHQHAHMEPPAAFTPFPTPCHTHQPHMPEERPLAVLCGAPHHRLKGTIDTIHRVCASITVVYVSFSQMPVLRCSRAHHTPFLQLPELPHYRLFHNYPTQTARATGNSLPGNQHMETAYPDFRTQNPYPVPATPPYTPIGLKHEPILQVMGQVPPLTLLLAPNDAKPRQATLICHGARSRIAKHHMTTQDLPAVPQDSQHMPRRVVPVTPTHHPHHRPY